jgi:EmrB/QacA subfamily drug resistance transporter
MTDLTDTTAGAADPATGRTQHLGWALVVISVAQLMVVLDGTITNIALPYIGADLGIEQANLSWIVTGYALAFGGLLLLGGRLGDLYGRRRVFMIGLVLFALASLVGGVAQSEAMLLASRGLQGLGAALASPAALALITTTFPAGPQRNRAFAVYAAMSGAGAAVGLILGGWLTGHADLFGLGIDGWRYTFLINVPIGIGAALAAPAVLAESEKHSGWLDVPGAITGTAGLLALVYGLTRAGEEAHGWGDTWTLASLAAGVALLVVFLLIETRVDHPILPLRIFRSQTRASSFVAMMIAPAAMFSMFYFLSLTIQQVIGYSPLQAGFAFLPFSVGIVIGAGLSSNLVSRVDPRFLAGTGTLVAAFSLFMFSTIDIDTSVGHVVSQVAAGSTAGDGYNYFAHVMPYIFTMSIGMGLTFVPVTLTAVHHVRAEDSGIGSGVLNTMQQVGGALGLAALSTVALSVINDRADTVAGPIAAELAKVGIDPGTAQGQGALQQAIFQATFVEGATDAIRIGSFMMLAASAVIWTFLRVKHEELATDGPEGAAVHV